MRNKLGCKKCRPFGPQEILALLSTPSRTWLLNTGPSGLRTESRFRMAFLTVLSDGYPPYTNLFARVGNANEAQSASHLIGSLTICFKP